ncbi:hypothetical protein NY99_07730 [Xanthomonas phaseoli pv. phaseoli]|nr:hypothetical protein NY99_07730 [Xanthomonas phaseoli pv. phaseoli]KHF48235.1 hypothetical protein QQ30_12065 [Xanthomonas phaseoli pv. phaseoli]KHS26652.1 hypothetical protein RM60_15840 [Xanthomonas phaseoli pv. phaseoli]
MPAELRDRLEEEAKRSGRSMNAELVYRLERSFPSVEAVMLQHRAAEGELIKDRVARLSERAAVLERRANDKTLASAERDVARRDLTELALRIRETHSMLDRILEDAKLLQSIAETSAASDAPRAIRGRRSKA